MKTKEDMEKEIVAFLTEMNTQDNRCTASPFYYTIRDYEWLPAPEGCGEETRYLFDDESFESMEDIEEQLEGLDEAEKEECLHRVTEYDVVKHSRYRGMFLTESDAENHLKLNSHHYSSEAHTYVNHAWRAPQLEQFLNNLQQYFNIEPRKK